MKNPDRIFGEIPNQWQMAKGDFEIVPTLLKSTGEALQNALRRRQNRIAEQYVSRGVITADQKMAGDRYAYLFEMTHRTGFPQPNWEGGAKGNRCDDPLIGTQACKDLYRDILTKTPRVELYCVERVFLADLKLSWRWRERLRNGLNTLEKLF